MLRDEDVEVLFVTLPASPLRLTLRTPAEKLEAQPR